MKIYHITNPAVENTLEQLFHVEDRVLDMNLPTFIVLPRGEGDKKQLLKRRFKTLVSELRSIGYLPKLRLISDQYHITIIRRKLSRPPQYRWNLILLLATSFTVLLDGFLRSNNPIFTRLLMSNIPALLNAALFTFSILGIFGLHELGHKVVAMNSGIDASMPYFIPAPPGFGGTFGAVITQREPPPNRDALFDLGISGPFIGFLFTIIVSIVGLKMSFYVSTQQLEAWLSMFPNVSLQGMNLPLLIIIINRLIIPSNQGIEMNMLLHPVGFAAWVGCIVTFINLIPSWQLDGGHITRALIGESKHKVVSFVGLFILILSGYYVMAIMLAFMMRSRRRSIGPLDDISPLSMSRKLFSISYVVMIVLTYVSVFTF